MQDFLSSWQEFRDRTPNTTSMKEWKLSASPCPSFTQDFTATVCRALSISAEQWENLKEERKSVATIYIPFDEWNKAQAEVRAQPSFILNNTSHSLFCSLGFRGACFHECLRLIFPIKFKSATPVVLFIRFKSIAVNKFFMSNVAFQSSTRCMKPFIMIKSVRNGKCLRKHGSPGPHPNFYKKERINCTRVYIICYKSQQIDRIFVNFSI